MSFVELDNLIRQRASILSWQKNASLRDSQSGTPYHLRVDIGGVQAMYCGQAYTGASNYHDAPKELNTAIIAEIDRRRHEIVKVAAETLVASIDQKIQSLRSVAERVLKDTCQGIEIEPGVFSGCDAAETGGTDCPACSHAEGGPR